MFAFFVFYGIIVFGELKIRKFAFIYYFKRKCFYFG